MLKEKNISKNNFKINLRCRSCGSKNLSKILNLGNFYLSDFVEKEKKLKQKKYPLQLTICDKCSLLQLKHSVAAKKMYNSSYGYRSGINNLMRLELADVVKKTKGLVKINDNDFVVDIGANDGTLLSFYPQNIIRVAVDPIEKFAKDSKNHASFVIVDFFNLKSLKKAYPEIVEKKAKIITAISMFYDLEKPNQFVSDIAKLLDPEGVFVIQQNYLAGMLEQNAYDNIVHEHLEYYSLTSLEKLLNRHKLSVFDVETREINGGSFRTYISHKETADKIRTKNVDKMLQKEKQLQLQLKTPYQDFSKRVKTVSKELQSLVKNEVAKGKKIYVYGASTRGNTILQYCKLDHKLIAAAVERNPEKWGKKIASTGIPIISEEQARTERPDYLLVLPWFFKEEFLKREELFLKSGGHFIFPLPKLIIV